MTTDNTETDPIEERIARYKNIADSFPIGHPEADKIYKQMEEIKKKNESTMHL